MKNGILHKPRVGCVYQETAAPPYPDIGWHYGDAFMFLRWGSECDFMPAWVTKRLHLSSHKKTKQTPDDEDGWDVKDNSKEQAGESLGMLRFSSTDPSQFPSSLTTFRLLRDRNAFKTEKRENCGRKVPTLMLEPQQNSLQGQYLSRSWRWWHSEQVYHPEQI